MKKNNDEAHLCITYISSAPSSAKLPSMINFNQRLNIHVRGTMAACAKTNLTAASYEQ